MVYGLQRAEAGHHLQFSGMKGVTIMTSTKKMFEEGQRFLLKGNFIESIEAFSKAINEGETSDTAFLSRGVAYLRNHEIDKAIHDFSEVVSHSDENVRAHFYKGVAFMASEDFEAAIVEFDRTIELQPEHGAAMFARGTAYAHMGNDEMASKNIKTAITLSESNVYGLQETIGLWRTQFERALSQISGEMNPPEMTLSHDEYHKVMEWLEEGYEKEKYH